MVFICCNTYLLLFLYILPQGLSSPSKSLFAVTYHLDDLQCRTVSVYHWCVHTYILARALGVGSCCVPAPNSVKAIPISDFIGSVLVNFNIHFSCFWWGCQIMVGVEILRAIAVSVVMGEKDWHTFNTKYRWFVTVRIRDFCACACMCVYVSACFLGGRGHVKVSMCAYGYAFLYVWF